MRRDCLPVVLMGLSVVGIFWLTGCEGEPVTRMDHPTFVNRESEKSADTTTETTPGDGSLSQYLAYAALHNAGLEAAFEKWKASLEMVPQAKAFPDPMLIYRQSLEREQTLDNRLMVEQMFPWFGKQDLRGRAVAEEARATRAGYEAERLRVFYGVKDAYYEYYFLSRSLAVTRENRELVKYLEEVSRTRYATGLGMQGDVILAQVELGKLEDQVRTLESFRAPLMARLNAAMNRPAGTELPWPEAIVEEKVAFTDEGVRTWMSAANPELKQMQYEIAREKARIELARKDFYPDVTLGLMYMGKGINPEIEDSKDDMLMLEVTVNLPIWRGKYRAGEREAQALYRAAMKSREEYERALEERLARVLYEFRDAQRKIGLYRDTLIPKARESVKSLEGAYRAGNATFIQLVDAERTLLEFNLSYERALATHAQRLAQTEMLVGRELPREAGGLSGPTPMEPEPMVEPAREEVAPGAGEVEEAAPAEEDAIQEN